MKVILASRGSRALAQTEMVRDGSGGQRSATDLIIIQTKGDKFWTSLWPKSVVRAYLLRKLKSAAG